MDTNNFFKNHFLGRDGFIWWIGQVAKEESWSNQAGEGWCNRVKVRIHGVHSEDTRLIANDDLPWAQVVIPNTEGGSSQGRCWYLRRRPGQCCPWILIRSC